MKASLSRTRKIIPQKFRKLHTNRLSDERKRDEKLVPVTDLLKKIVTQRDEINQNREPNMRNNMNENDGMEIDPNEFDDFVNPPPRYERPPPPYDPPPPPPPPRTPPAAQFPPIPPRPRNFQRNQPNIPSRRSSPATTPPPPIPPLPISLNRPSLNNGQMRQFFDDIIQNNNNNSRLNRKRSSIPTAEVDVFDTSNRKVDSKMRRQKVELIDLDSEEHNSEGAVGRFDTRRPNSQNSRNVDDIMTEEEDNDITLNTDYYDESTNDTDVLRRKRFLTRHELQQKKCQL